MYQTDLFSICHFFPTPPKPEKSLVLLHLFSSSRCLRQKGSMATCTCNSSKRRTCTRPSRTRHQKWSRGAFYITPKLSYGPQRWRSTLHSKQHNQKHQNSTCKLARLRTSHSTRNISHLGFDINQNFWQHRLWICQYRYTIEKVLNYQYKKPQPTWRVSNKSPSSTLTSRIKKTFTLINEPPANSTKGTALIQPICHFPNQRNLRNKKSAITS